MGKSMKKNFKTPEVIHPTSRTAHKMSKKVVFNARRDKQGATRSIKLTSKGLMTLWIQEHLVPGKDTYTAAETAQLALEYVNRHDDEIATLERTGVSVGRKIALQKLREQELAEFIGKGVDLPDLRLATMVRVLRAWDGELNSLQKLEYAAFKQNMLVQ